MDARTDAALTALSDRVTEATDKLSTENTEIVTELRNVVAAVKAGLSQDDIVNRLGGITDRVAALTTGIDALSGAVTPANAEPPVVAVVEGATDGN